MLHFPIKGDVEKCFTPEAVERVQNSQYDEKTRDVSTPIDAQSSRIDKEDAELNFEEEEEQISNIKSQRKYPLPNWTQESYKASINLK